MVECGEEKHAWLKCIAAGVVGNMSDAEDIVQQAYAIAIEKNQSFESRYKFLGWLGGIVRHCALNERRKRQRRKTSAVDPSKIQKFVGDVTRVESATIVDGKNVASLQSEFDDEVLKALESISVDARTCMLLRIVENLSYKEISILMQIPEGTAMSLVHRARASLRVSLANHEFARPSRQGGFDAKA